MTSKVTIICRRPGMFRNGVAHEAKAVYDADRWTPEQMENFRNDPAFEVVEGEHLSEDVMTLASENAMLRSQVSDLSLKLTAITTERDQLLAKNNEGAKLMSQLQGEFTDAKNALSALTAELEKLKAEAEKAEAMKVAAKK